MKIGVITDCFKKDTMQAIKIAGKLGLDGVQIYATTGEFSPETSKQDKLEYKRLLMENGLVVSALCGDMGGFGFEIEKDNTERIEKTKKIIDLAKEFETHIVTTHIGVIPEDKKDPRYSVMLNALTECGIYAKENGITLAIETGPEKATTLLQFLKDTKGGIGVNLDPANFVMVTRQDPVEAVNILKDYIVHTHVKDGICFDRNQDPVAVYHAFAIGGIEAVMACKGFKEVPVGEGEVKWREYIKALVDVGFDGFLTIERECGDNPTADIIQTVRFISGLIDRK